MLKKMVLLASVMIMGCVFVSAARGQAPAPAKKPAPVAAQTPTIKPSGTLTVLYSTLWGEVWLPWGGSASQLAYSGVPFDNLVDRDLKTRDIIPGLATWAWSPDGKTVTFTLRKGVPFHGGWGELTAEDAKYSLEMHAVSKASVSSLKNNFSPNVEAMNVLDRYRFEIKFKKPSGVALDILASGQIALITSKKYIEEKGEAYAEKNPIGTGPWQFVEQQPGQLMKFKAVENHWRQPPEYEFLVLKKVPEEFTRIAMLKTGEADLAMISHQSIAEVQKSKGLKLITMTGAYANSIAFGGMLASGDKRYKAGYHRSDPWADVRVRQAMDLAIDKNAIIKAIYQGYAKPTAIAPIIYPDWQSFPPHPYDPAKAKRLLAEAGYPNGFEVEIRAWPHPPASEQPVIAEAVSLYWEKIGLKTKIVLMEYATFRSSWLKGDNARHVYPMRMGVEAWEIFSDNHFFSGGAMPAYQDPALDRLLQRAYDPEGAANPKKRVELMKEFGKTLSDQYGTIPIAVVDEVWAAGPRVRDWDLKVGLYANHLETVRRPR